MKWSLVFLLFSLFAHAALAADLPQAASVASTITRPTVAPAQSVLAPSVAREAARLARAVKLEPARVQQIPQQPSKKGWIGRHPKLFGALVGFGVGCPLGVSQVGGSEDNFFNALDEFACPVVGGIGAAAGVVIGWAVSRGQ